MKTNSEITETHEGLLLATVFDLYDWPACPSLLEDFEGVVLDFRLHIGVVKFAAHETLHVEDGVVGTHRDLIHRGNADSQFSTM